MAFPCPCQSPSSRLVTLVGDGPSIESVGVDTQPEKTAPKKIIAATTEEGIRTDAMADPAKKEMALKRRIEQTKARYLDSTTGKHGTITETPTLDSLRIQPEPAFSPPE